MQQFLRSLIPPLRASGAKASVVDGLEEMGLALEPFQGQAVEAFAAFLRRAEEYDRTGIVPAVAKAPPRSRAKKEATPAYTPEEALRDIRSLFDRCLDDGVTHAMIAAEVKKLDKLKKADLDRVVAEFGLSKARTKPAALDAIREKIEGHKKSHSMTKPIRTPYGGGGGWS